MGDKPDNDKPDNDKPDTGDPKPDNAPDFEADAKKWKALARKHEDQSKANAAELKKLTDAGDANKSELQRLTEAVTAMQKRAEDAEAAALRAEVAQAKGLTAAQAKRLTGTTREELEEDADDLMEAFKPAADDGKPSDNGDKPKPSGAPKERLKPGASSDTEPDEDLDKIIEKVPRI